MTGMGVVRLLGAAVLALGCAGCVIHVPAGSFGSMDVHERQVVVEVPHVDGSALHAETRNGSLSAERQARNDVRISAVLRSPSRDRLESAAVVARQSSEGALEIFVEWPGGDRPGNEGCSMQISLPDAEGVELVTSNGRVVCAGLSGAARLTTSNGKIVVEGQDGDVVARTSNGGVFVEGCAGRVDVQTSNGGVEVEDAKGAVTVATSNGGVEVDLDDSCTGPIRVATSNGDVTLALGPAFDGVLSAATSNGRVRANGVSSDFIRRLDKHRGEFVFGPGRSESIVTTSNGSVVVSADVR